IHHGDEARHRAQQDPRHDPHLSDARRSQQVRGGLVEASARPRRLAAEGGALPRMAARLAVVIPTLDEAGRICASLEALAPLRSRGHELIVVAGGSRDATVELARPLAAQVLLSPTGRAAQLNVV